MRRGREEEEEEEEGEKEGGGSRRCRHHHLNGKRWGGTHVGGGAASGFARSGGGRLIIDYLSLSACAILNHRNRAFYLREFPLMARGGPGYCTVVPLSRMLLDTWSSPQGGFVRCCHVYPNVNALPREVCSNVSVSRSWTVLIITVPLP